MIKKRIEDMSQGLAGCDFRERETAVQVFMCVVMQLQKVLRIGTCLFISSFRHLPIRSLHLYLGSDCSSCTVLRLSGTVLYVLSVQLLYVCDSVQLERPYVRRYSSLSTRILQMEGKRRKKECLMNDDKKKENGTEMQMDRKREREESVD